MNLIVILIGILFFNFSHGVSIPENDPQNGTESRSSNCSTSCETTGAATSIVQYTGDKQGPSELTIGQALNPATSYSPERFSYFTDSTQRVTTDRNFTRTEMGSPTQSSITDQKKEERGQILGLSTVQSSLVETTAINAGLIETSSSSTIDRKSHGSVVTPKVDTTVTENAKAVTIDETETSSGSSSIAVITSDGTTTITMSHFESSTARPSELESATFAGTNSTDDSTTRVSTEEHATDSSSIPTPTSSSSAEEAPVSDFSTTSRQISTSTSPIDLWQIAKLDDVDSKIALTTTKGSTSPSTTVVRETFSETNEKKFPIKSCKCNCTKNSKPVNNQKEDTSVYISDVAQSSVSTLSSFSAAPSSSAEPLSMAESSSFSSLGLSSTPSTSLSTAALMSSRFLKKAKSSASIAPQRNGIRKSKNIVRTWQGDFEFERFGKVIFWKPVTKLKTTTESLLEIVQNSGRVKIFKYKKGKADDQF